MQYFSHLDKREVLQHEYSQLPILPSPHFRYVVNMVLHVLVYQCCLAEKFKVLGENSRLGILPHLMYIRCNKQNLLQPWIPAAIGLNIS